MLTETPAPTHTPAATTVISSTPDQGDDHGTDGATHDQGDDNGGSGSGGDQGGGGVGDHGGGGDNKP